MTVVNLSDHFKVAESMERNGPREYLGDIIGIQNVLSFAPVLLSTW